MGRLIRRTTATLALASTIALAAPAGAQATDLQRCTAANRYCSHTATAWSHHRLAAYLQALRNLRCERYPSTCVTWHW